MRASSVVAAAIDNVTREPSPDTMAEGHDTGGDKMPAATSDGRLTCPLAGRVLAYQDSTFRVRRNRRVQVGPLTRVTPGTMFPTSRNACGVRH